YHKSLSNLRQVLECAAGAAHSIVRWAFSGRGALRSDRKRSWRSALQDAGALLGRPACLIAITSTIWLAPLASFAELPVARLFSVFPPAGKAGTTVEVEVAGQDLDDVRALHFSNTNLTAKHLSGAKFSVTIPTNTLPGICD